jgi:endoglycosylceramidase
MWWAGYCKTVSDYGWRYDSEGNPLIEDCQKTSFFMYYAMPETVSLFNKLYDNTNGMQDKFIKYWATVSQKFAKNPFVIGYDPLNEPWPSTLFADPMMELSTGGFDEAKLSPMYGRAFDEYMKADDSKIMMFEGTQFPDIVGAFGGIINPVGFQELPGGNDRSSNQVLNEHTYCCQMGASVCATGEPPVSLKKECASFHDRRLNQRQKDAERLGVPLIITEFGACFDSAGCAMEIGLVTSKADEVNAGWAYWEFKNYWDFTTSAGTGSEGFYNTDGTLQQTKVKALSRSYLPYTQGRINTMKFDADTGDFSAALTVDTTIAEPSVLFVSEDFWFKDAKKVVELSHRGTTLESE